jgi:hypothetical protein
MIPIDEVHHFSEGLAQPPSHSEAQRLWCVFEMAAFAWAHRREMLDIDHGFDGFNQTWNIYIYNYMG